MIPIDVPAAAVAVNWALDRCWWRRLAGCIPSRQPAAPGVDGERKSSRDGGELRDRAGFGSRHQHDLVGELDLVADRYGWFTGTPRPAPFALPRQDVSAFPGERPAPRRPDGRYSVLYIGDSMASSTKDALSTQLPAWHFSQLTFGGTAPCDWSGGRVKDLAASVEPDLVVFSFLGNNLTPCTGGATGQALTDNFFTHLATICRDVAPARCVAVGQPALGPWVSSSFLSVEQPTDMYRREARGRPVGLRRRRRGRRVVVGLVRGRVPQQRRHPLQRRRRRSLRPDIGRLPDCDRFLTAAVPLERSPRRRRSGSRRWTTRGGRALARLSCRTLTSDEIPRGARDVREQGGES